jgi:L-lactate dehydrogenase complex protein LldF
VYQYIYEHRRIIAEDEKLVKAPEPFVMGQYGRVIGSSTLYDFGSRMARFARFLPKTGPLKEWTRERELPEIDGRRFRDWFKKHNGQGGQS